MGIRFYCPDCGRRLNIKSFLAGKRGICPHCDSGVLIPMESQLPSDAPKFRPTAESTAGPVATSREMAPANTASPITAPDTAPIDPQSIPESTPVIATSDPIAESPESVWYVRPSVGGQYGPARGDVMRRWLEEGRVNPDSMVWREDWEDWQVAGPLFPSLESDLTSETSAKSTSAPSFVVPKDEEQDITKPVAAPARSSKTTNPTARMKSKKKSIAPLIVLGLLIVGLLVVTVVVLQK